MQQQQQTTPIWPFMLVLAFLFAMSVSAPRSWEKYAHRDQVVPPATSLSPTSRPGSVPFQTRPPFVTNDVKLPPQIFGRPAEPQPRIAAEFPSPARAEPNPPTVGPRLNGAGAPRLNGSTPSPIVPEARPAPEAVSQIEPPPVLVAQATPSVQVPQAVTPAPTVNGVRINLNGSRKPTPQPLPPQHQQTTGAPAAMPTTTQPAYQVADRGPKATTPETIAPQNVFNTQPRTSPVGAPQTTAMRTPGVNPVLKVPQPQAVVSDEPPAWWPKPTDLFARLDKLRQRRETRPWAERTTGLLGRLAQPTAPTPAGIQEIVRELRTAANDPNLLDERTLDPATAVEVRLVRHALLRRLDVWESLGNLLRRGHSTPTIAAKSQNLEICLVELERQTTAAGDSGKQWHDYLMLDSLRQVTSDHVGETTKRTVARQVLTRLSHARDASEQNNFLKQGAFAELDMHLRLLAAEDIDGRRLLTSIEQFEASELPADAHALADECRKLEYAADADSRQLANWLTSHYRNANVRLMLSADLLNRMLPESLKQDGPVNETLLGYPTKGWGTTRTGLAIKFVPSQQSLAVRLEAQGVMNAQTKTYTGAVRLFNHSNSHFTAHKDFALTFDGLKIDPAQAVTQSRAKLRGVDTNYDRVPILGTIVEAVAIDEHKDNRFAALREVATKTSRHVEKGLDAEIDKHLEQADVKLHEWIIDPLAQLRIEPELIELQSNESQAIMRMRVAGSDQLASHTPRPRVDNEGLGSLQIHQSAVNNILERSQLQGRRFTAPELYRLAVEEFGLPDTMDPAELPADIALTFATIDPLTVRFGEGRIELRLALRELRRADSSWENITVRVEFKPTLIEGRMCLVRDGIVRISGQGLSTTGQIPLRTIFAKVFPDDAYVQLWPDRLRADERFSDLDLDRVELRDGWMATSIGLRRQTTALLPPRR